MRVDLFDFDLPEERIALRPAEPRDAARLLLVPPDEAFRDLTIGDLPDLLRPGDAIVLNDTRVVPARLRGVRERDGNVARLEILLHRRVGPERWRAFARPAKRLAPGDRLRFGAATGGLVCELGGFDAVVEDKDVNGDIGLRFELSGPALDEAVAAHGEVPLPPYIAGQRAADDRDRRDYQTVYAQHDGAVAAPTAGLHFTDALFASLEKRGISRHLVTLHVGAGTFLPVKAEDTGEHRMHAEWGSVGGDTAAALNAVRDRGGRIVAIGTTSLRLLESAADQDHKIQGFDGWTEIFITPGYRFRGVDLLMTNFHLPRSTLFMLVSAFAGLDRMQAAYAHAIADRYRFYSYGDACLLHPAGTGA
ncbi:MAG: tRNA preQ1(34) S-adenosylmethionine ribosyltransferase-isomerase QueA [Enterovirga sp.]|nr:tRNA preQ1(34) S-adenosylmethionine ribosyltransferase-isomerase QueA [Enterovirga sp.]